MYLLTVAFFVIALAYSMVGLGGGTAYITAMVLAGTPKETFPAIALSCNLLVASQGFYRFRKAGHFRWRLFWPFAVTSIPCSYIGGRLHVPDKIFTWILATALTLAAVRLIFWKPHPPLNPLPLASGRQASREGKNVIVIQLIICIILGFLAGITGIGGGIFLIPTLLSLGWASAKEASATASLFILVNSLSGLFGQLHKGYFDLKLFAPLACAVIIGGFIGSKMGAEKLKGSTLQKIVGVIILIAVVKLVLKCLSA